MAKTPLRATTAPRVEGELRSVGYSGKVRLNGRLGERVADAAQTYSSLSNDDILHGFRLQAGKPAPGSPMRGWASESTHMTFGQWVSGLVRLGAATGNADLTSKASALLGGYADTLDASGDTHMNIYAWEKLVGGIVDTISFGDYPDAEPLLGRIARGEHFDRTRAVARANDFSGQEPRFLIEWYTLAENLYKGYQLTGDEFLAELASEWHYDAYWDRFRERPSAGSRWNIPAWLHAYSHVNTFASVAATFEVHRDPRLLDVLRNAHDWLRETQMFSTGGFGPHEFTMPEDGSLGRSLEWVTDSAEITCGSWGVFKLVSPLLRHTGEARYLDVIERLVYNGIGATVPVRPDGRTPYYADYRLGVATKLPYWNEWPCCSGTYIQAVAHLHDYVFFETDDGVAIGLYVPSEYTGVQRGTSVRIAQNTRLPECDDTSITVSTGAPVEFTLRLRVPAWSTFEVAINGDAVEVRARADEWVEIRRTWGANDVVALRLHPHLLAEPVDEYHPNRVAMLYGPVVLVQDVDWFTPFDAPVPWAMVDWESHLKRTGDGLVFMPTQPGTHRMPPGAFRPFFEIPERQPYRMYHDLGARRIV